MRYDVDVRKMNDPVLTKAELVKELRGLGLGDGAARGSDLAAFALCGGR